MAENVAEQFVETLAPAEAKGFGRHQGKIEWIHVRHEEVAGAEAHLTCELAVCGPGNLHLMNKLFDCHGSPLPVRGISEHVDDSGARIADIPTRTLAR